MTYIADVNVTVARLAEAHVQTWSVQRWWDCGALVRIVRA